MVLTDGLGILGGAQDGFGRRRRFVIACCSCPCLDEVGGDLGVGWYWLPPAVPLEPLGVRLVRVLIGVLDPLEALW